MNETEKIMIDVLEGGRTSCYKARDAFYSCLEKQAIMKPSELGSVGLLFPSKCKKSRTEYVHKCRPTWVKHFDRQYCTKKNGRYQRLLDPEGSCRGSFWLPRPPFKSS